MAMQTYRAGGITLPVPVLVGAGVAKSPEETAKWLEVAPTVSGSYTLEAQSGNVGVVLYPETEEEFLRLGYAVNSYGMPNCGIHAAIDAFKTQVRHNPRIISIAGFSVDDFITMYKLLVQHWVADAVEFNVGCPNIEGKRISSFHLMFLEELFHALLKMHLSEWIRVPVLIKVSPYSDPWLLQEVAELIGEFREVIAAVVTCNTVPNVYPGPGLITPNNGLGGKSGPGIASDSQGQLMQFRAHLPKEVDVTSVGGIMTGNDIMDRLERGAAAV